MSTTAGPFHSGVSGVMLIYKNSCESQENIMGMDYETAAHTEQPLALPAAPRTEAEVTHSVKQHEVAHCSGWKLERAY